MKSLVGLGFSACLSLIACDQIGVAKHDVEGQLTEPARPATEEWVADSGDALASCLSTCENDNQNEDDVATCRVLCKSAHGEPTPRPELGAYMGCYDECAGPTMTGENRPTCRLNCAASVAGDEGELAESRCPRTCLQDLGACLATCEGVGKTDDAATCRVTCKQLGGNCLDGCTQPNPS